MKHIVVTLLILLVSVPARALELSAGPVQYQVISCDVAGSAELKLVGTAEGEGIVQGRILHGAQEIIPWTGLGTISDGKWQGLIANIPAGGPYHLELRQIDPQLNEYARLAVSHWLVGDLWLLAGQSNMQGVGNMADAVAPHPQVHAFTMGYAWQLAREPLHVLPESPDQAHFDEATGGNRGDAIQWYYSNGKGAGLGLPFAKALVAATGRPVGLICTAHGGTSMDQWDPALRDQGGNSLYGSMYRMVEAAGGRVRGLLWYQGESDTVTMDLATAYGEKMRNLVAKVREDLQSPQLPFYYVQIGRFVHPDTSLDAPWNMVQTTQLALAPELAPGGLVAAIDLELDDAIHIGTKGLVTLGKRLARLAQRDLHGTAEIQPGPRIVQATREDSSLGPRIVVRLEGVNGRIDTSRPLRGFSVSAGPDAPSSPLVYKTEAAAPDTLHVYLREWPENPHLWYGRGLDPVCTIIDSLDMALPVTGPVAVQ